MTQTFQKGRPTSSRVIIRPFRAIHYSLHDLSEFVAPPYDVIDKGLQEELYRKNPNNIVRLDLNHESDPYSAAAAEMRRMIKEKILVQDNEPAIYPYFQTFRSQDGDFVTRRGFVSWIRLEPFEAGVVLPHEHTLSGPKLDRLNLMLATKATFSQIFGLYSDQSKSLECEYDKLKNVEPFLEAEYDGVKNEIYRITDAETLEKFQDVLSRLQIYIADGHHRYETALEYQRLKRKGNPEAAESAYDFVMMYLTNVFDSGLVVYPTHRIIHSLPDFSLNEFFESLKTFFELTQESSIDRLANSLAVAGAYSFGMVLPGGRYFLMKLKSDMDVLRIVKEELPQPVKRLDVTLLHDVVFRQLLGISKEAQEKKLNINYTIDRQKVNDAIQVGEGQVGFLLNPTKVEQVQEVANVGAVMPQKSTYFYPKLLSGMLISSLE